MTDTTAYAFTPPAVPSLPVAGRAERFPIQRVFCVGRNYAAHAREMGKDPDREPPFFFMKPALAVVGLSAPGAIAYPPQTRNLHHEVELVVALARGGRDIALDDALSHVYGYAVGLDMTRRDLQTEAKDKGRPWEFGKSFLESAPIGALSRAQDVGHPAHAAIWLEVNGERRQTSNIDQMIWSVAECISVLSRFDALHAGDLIMTGTPEGVGAVQPGDTLRAGIEGLDMLMVSIQPLRP